MCIRDRNCAMQPMITSFGRLNTTLKSSGFRVRPMPNITMPSRVLTHEMCIRDRAMPFTSEVFGISTKMNAYSYVDRSNLDKDFSRYSVSYTHLDVYKRQSCTRSRTFSVWRAVQLRFAVFSARFSVFWQTTRTGVMATFTPELPS